MSRPHDESLSPEERALADRLARLGPHDGPPPALDAKILSAAHAAVAGPRRRRWLGLTAIPGGLITGAGMAAALVVVVGLAWQLRPSSPVPQVPREEGDMEYISAEILERAPPAPPPAPPPPPAQEVAPRRALQPPAPAVARMQAPAAAAPAAEDHSHYVDEAIGHAPATASVAAAAADAAAGAVPYAAPASPPAPPAPAAIAAAQAEADARADEARQQVAAESSARERSEAMVAAKARATSAAAAPMAAKAEAASAGPVDADAQLEPARWLQRIRERRDAGDLDGARESLKHFREAHPRVRVPRDLRELADPATR